MRVISLRRGFSAEYPNGWYLREQFNPNMFNIAKERKMSNLTHGLQSQAFLKQCHYHEKQYHYHEHI